MTESDSNGFLVDVDAQYEGTSQSAASEMAEPEAPQRISALMDKSQQLALKDQFVGMNALLLSIACLGAFLLLTVNLVGIFFCKGFLKKKAHTSMPAALYPPSLSQSRRGRYAAILGRFSTGDDSQHGSLGLNNLRAGLDAPCALCCEKHEACCVDKASSSHHDNRKCSCCFSGKAACSNGGSAGSVRRPPGQQNRSNFTVINVPEVLLVDESPHIVSVDGKDNKRRLSSATGLKQTATGGKNAAAWKKQSADKTRANSEGGAAAAAAGGGGVSSMATSQTEAVGRCPVVSSSRILTSILKRKETN